MSEVSREVEEADAIICLMQLTHDLERTIEAAIIDQDELPVLADGIHRFGDATIELVQDRLLVVHRGHDRDDRAMGVHGG
jgi:hypothetical protein